MHWPKSRDGAIENNMQHIAVCSNHEWKES